MQAQNDPDPGTAGYDCGEDQVDQGSLYEHDDYEHTDAVIVIDADGHSYLDLIGSWGPLILGHAHPELVATIQAALVDGTTFGAPTEIEVRFAEALRAAVPSMELVRAVSSGTEATMSALRLARGFTGRPRIIKADGGYHGHADCLLVAAGSGAATLGIPGSAGVPDGAARDTVVVPYNDLASVERALAAGDVAAIIVEPVAGNMGLVEPAPGYLEGLRALATRHGTVLIFDEVMTGFRVALGGAAEMLGVQPDLAIYAKAIASGFPLAAVVGTDLQFAEWLSIFPIHQRAERLSRREGILLAPLPQGDQNGKQRTRFVCRSIVLIGAAIGRWLHLENALRHQRPQPVG